MSMPIAPRLALAPLIERLGLDTAVVFCEVNDGWGNGAQGEYERHAPQTLLAELLSVTRRSVGRWAVEGIPLPSAEDACFALGLHPCEVWFSEWIDAAIGDAA